MRQACVAVLVLACCSAIDGRAASAASGAEGSLDAGFGGDGIVATALGAGDAVAGGVAVQPDGKLVVAGRAAHGADRVFALARYRRNGALDPGFGNNGTVMTRFGAFAEALAVVVQPDGKIIAAGTASVGSVSEFALSRYTANGSLDTTFSGDGKLTTAITPGGSYAVAIALQADGRIVVAGRTSDTNRFAVARYLWDGRRDSSFGDDGRVTTGIGTAAYGDALTIQWDGKLVVAGESFDGVSMDFALVRYNTDGSLDLTFSGDGKLTTAIGASEDAASGVAVQADHRIVAAGWTFNGSDYDFALARYLPDGSLDATFGDDGKVATSIGTRSDGASAVALQRDGKIVAVGRADSGPTTAFALARYNGDGSPDRGFSGDGKLVTAVGAIHDWARSVAVQRDGKIVAAGFTDAGATDEFALTRYIGDANGPFDARVSGLQRYSTAMRRTLTWTASDDNTGVRTYRVRYRAAGAAAGSYGAYQLWRAGTAAPSGLFRGTVGQTYCFSVRARDWAGNLGRWGTPSCVAFPVNDRALTASAHWMKLTAPAYYAGTARRSATRGATLQLENTHYRHLALVATTRPGAGSVRIYRDNHLVKRISLAATRVHHRVVIPVASSIDVRTGTIRIVQASGGKPVTIEGLAVSRA